MSSLNEFVAKLRGLPWSATVDQVLDFFTDSRIKNGKEGVHMTFTREGKPSGEAFVEFENPEDLDWALKRNNEYMGNRYIEVTKSDLIEMNDQLRRTGLSDKNANDGIVRLRGLPFNCTMDDIVNFFSDGFAHGIKSGSLSGIGLEIMLNGITIMTDFNGKKTGEAYVQFVNRESTDKALQRHREKIGHRYIEIFRSTLYELMNTSNTGPDRRSNFGNMRTAPYERNDRFSGVMGPSGNNSNRYGNQWENESMLRNGNDSNNYNMPMNEWGGNYGRPPMGFIVHMRGLPFKATQFDICDFFNPIKPTKVHIIMDRIGRASGEADVEFESYNDAQRAMLKDRSLMQHRYIELFMEPNSFNSNMTPPMGIGMNSGPNMGMGISGMPNMGMMNNKRVGSW